MKDLRKEKDKKEKSHPLGWWRKKCDSKLQDKRRKEIEKCEVCGKRNEVAHHYHPKSSSSYLRFDVRNLIALCHGCHFRHHNCSDPSVHNTVNAKRGQMWVDELEKDKRKPCKRSIGDYKLLLEELSK